jgi:uncharacterized membrane protein
MQIYIVAFLFFIIIDGVWLYFASSFYSSYLEGLLASEVNWLAAILFYFLYVFGLCYFIIAPNRMSPITLEISLHGGLFTFIAYATYDLTNLATIKNWPLVVSLVDMSWAVILGSSVTFLTLFILQRRFR